MNTFAGVLMVSDNNLEPNNTLVDFFISSIKPLILNKYIHIGWPIIDVPAMGINNFFKDSYGIYGLAGSIVSEMILYKDYNIVIILWLMLFVFIVNTMQKINSFTIKIYYIFILIQIPSIFRWSGLVFISSNINLFIYIFVPLIIAEYIILKKVFLLSL
ncbi:hypothetical protein HOK00_06545 [bacterium]|nr:hypothetical protein [bacterium]